MTRKIANLASVLILAASLAACDTAEERAEKHFQSAVALIAEGDTQRAIVEFRNVFELDPSHQGARHAYAKLSEDAGNQNEALQNYLLLAEQYPDDGDAALAIARISVMTNRWKEAERYGRRAEELLPNDPSVRLITINLDYRQAVIDGDAQTRALLAQEAIDLMATESDLTLINRLAFDWNVFQGRDREALVHLDNAIAVQPGELSLYQARLSVLDRLGETPEIQRQLREMVDLFPGVPAVRQTLFAWLMNNGNPDEAENFLRELVENSSPDDIDANQVNLIQFVRTQHGNDAALAEIEAIIPTVEDPSFYQTLQASIQFDEGERDTAIEILEGVITGAEASDQIRNSKIILARMLIQTGNQVGGRALIEEVVAEDPAHVAGSKMKAELLIESDKASEAIVLLRAAQEQAPQDAEIFSLIARAHERNGNRDLAGDMLARAAEMSNRSPVESIRLAKFLVGREQHTAAEQALIESLRRNENNPNLLIELGQVYLRMEKAPEAAQVESSLRGLGDEASIAAADGIRLGILRIQNRTEDMVALLETVGQGSSQSVVAVMRAHLASGDVDKARETITKALSADPQNNDLRFANAVLQGALGEVDEARATMRSILDEVPRASNVWLSLARSYAGAGQMIEAEAVIDEAIVAVPNSGDIRWAKAGYLERRGEIGAAIDIYEDLYDASSSSLIAANNLVSRLTSYRQTPETIERAFNIARRLRGIPQPAFQDTYGWIAFLRGELNLALEHLEPAAEGLPGDPLVQYHLARTLEALNRPKDAAEVYARAIQVLGDRENEAMQDVAVRLAELEARAQ